MRAKHSISAALISMLVLSGCMEGIDQNDPNRKTKEGAILGGLVGAAIGATTSDNKKKGIFKGAIIGAGAGAIAGSILDKQEADLRRDLGNDAIDVRNAGDRLVVTLPQDVLFASDSYTVRSDLRRDLNAVAGNLMAYPNSTIQVIGHTDNVGDAAYNEQLSMRRANAVADVLMEAGIGYNRIQTIGRGENQPVASNLDPMGRAQNRRVEIVIIPNA